MSDWNKYNSGSGKTGRSAASGSRQPNKRVLIFGPLAMIAFIIVAIGVNSLALGTSPLGATDNTIPPTLDNGLNVPRGPSLTVPGGAPNYETAPEGAVATPEQLAVLYPRSASTLSDADYNAAVEVAKAFSLAEATGLGAENFPAYWDGEAYSNTPWVTNYNFKYATAEQNAETRRYIRALVFWDGIALQGQRQLAQVTHRIYLERTAQGLRPVQPIRIESEGLETGGTWDTEIRE